MNSTQAPSDVMSRPSEHKWDHSKHPGYGGVKEHEAKIIKEFEDNMPPQEEASTLVLSFKEQFFDEEYEIIIQRGDLDNSLVDEYINKPYLFVDTETKGLNPRRDRLKSIQLLAHGGHKVSLILPHLTRGWANTDNLWKVFTHGEKNFPAVVAHYAPFDLAMLYLNIGDFASKRHAFCTRAASKIIRTYSGSHSLKDVVKEYLGVDMDKSFQTIDWNALDRVTKKEFPNDLMPAIEYACMDVIVLPRIVERFAAEAAKDPIKFEALYQIMSTIPGTAWLNAYEYADALVR